MAKVLGNDDAFHVTHFIPYYLHQAQETIKGKHKP